jgi:hypothetical protein
MSNLLQRNRTDFSFVELLLGRFFIAVPATCSNEIPAGVFIVFPCIGNGTGVKSSSVLM